MTAAAETTILVILTASIGATISLLRYAYKLSRNRYWKGQLINSLWRKGNLTSNKQGRK